MTTLSDAEVRSNGKEPHAPQRESRTLPAQGPQAKAGQIVNEMGREVQQPLPDPSSPKTPGNKSYGRGAGLEVDLVGQVPTTNPVLPVNTVKVSSPPKEDDVREVGPVPLDPVAYATLLRGEAHSDWNDNTCILGKPISQGKGLASDVQLVNTLVTVVPWSMRTRGVVGVTEPLGA